MRQLVYHVATSLDGLIARHNGAYDFFLPGGEHIADFLASLGRFDTVLMGRKTYEVGSNVGVTNPYPALKSYVFSRSLARSPDPQVELVSEDPSEFVRTLKRQPGKDLWLCGGAELATSLFRASLIDEVIVKLNPVLAGAGIGMLAGPFGKIELDLLDTKTYDNGMLVLRYRVRNVEI